MAKAQIGNIVKVHYTVKDSDNQIFETSRGNSPLKFEIGSGSIMPRLDEELQGMQGWRKKNIHRAAGRRIREKAKRSDWKGEEKQFPESY